MDSDFLESLVLLDDEDAPFEARCRASILLAQQAGLRPHAEVDIPRAYQAAVGLWKDLGQRRIDRCDTTLILIRRKLARSCWTLSLGLPAGRKFFECYPRPSRVEGPDSERPGTPRRGRLRCGYGSSIYEFHWEYPIEGFGVKKDLISVVTDDEAREPLFDWCARNDVIVFCNRCGLEITYEVSKDCPWRRSKPG